MVKDKFFNDFVKKYVSPRQIGFKNNLNQNIIVLMDTADELINNDEFNKAVEIFDKIINEFPNFEVFNQKGHLLIRLGKYDEAIMCFEKSLEYKKLNNYSAHVGKSFALLNILKLHECNATEIDWDNKFKSMMNHINVACLINDEGYIFKAKILNGLGQYNGALNSIDELLKSNILENEEYIKALLEKSLAYRQLGEYNQAIECCDEILKIDENINVLLNKGEMLFILKDYTDSINSFNSVLKKDSRNINALMYLGLIYPNFNDFNKALDCFDKILEIDSSLYNALIYKAELLVNLHRFIEALDCFDKCCDKLSNDYLKLYVFAQQQLLENNQTQYYAVTKTDFANFKYVYSYIENGFRKIYGESLADLKMKIFAKNRLWTTINNKKFIKNPFTNENHDFVKKYIKCYYKGEFSEFHELISSILNNDFLEKLDQNKIDFREILNSRDDIEKDIINDLVYTMIEKLNFVHSQNTTGYFGVITQKRSDGVRWSYLDLVRREYFKKNVIYARTLDELEQLVKSEDLLWYIFDDELAKYSQERDSLNL